MENRGEKNEDDAGGAERVAKAKEIAERLVRADNADNGDYLEEHEAKQELLAHLRTMTDEERAQAFPWYKRGEKGNAPDGGGAVEVALAEDDATLRTALTIALDFYRNCSMMSVPGYQAAMTLELEAPSMFQFKNDNFMRILDDDLVLTIKIGRAHV